MAEIDQLVPPLIVMSSLGIVGFVMSLGWSKVTTGGCDRDKIVFLAKMWGGIAVVSIILVFIVLA